MNYGLVFWGEQRTSSGLAAVLQATIPAFGLALAHFFVPSDRMTLPKVLGVCFGIAGVEEWTGSAQTRSVGGLVRRLVPAFYIENEPDAAEAVYNWFLPSAASLAALLSSVGFSDVRHVPISVERNLFVCTQAGDASHDARAGSYRARFVARESVVSVSEAGEVLLAIRVWNVGTAAWEASAGREEERGAVLLGVHLLDEAENVLEWDYRRYRGALSGRVRPGEWIDMDVRLPAPPARTFSSSISSASSKAGSRTWEESRSGSASSSPDRHDPLPGTNPIILRDKSCVELERRRDDEPIGGITLEVAAESR